MGAGIVGRGMREVTERLSGFRPSTSRRPSAWSVRLCGQVTIVDARLVRQLLVYTTGPGRPRPGRAETIRAAWAAYGSCATGRGRGRPV